MPVDKVSRLLTLLNVLLDAPRPLTARELRQRVPGYPDNDASFRRAFERDKGALADMLGHAVAPETVPGADPPIDGYRLRPTDAYLRDPGLSREERTALGLAASAVRLAGVDPRGGAWKLGAAADDPVATGSLPAELPGGPQLVALFSAVVERRRANFTYRRQPRRVRPLRLNFSRGRWYLTAHDEDRDALRRFRLDRIEGEVTTGAAGAFAPMAIDEPAGPDEPWAMGSGDPVTARVLIDAEATGAARSLAPRAEVVEHRDDGSIVLALPVRTPAALLSFALGLLDRAEVLDPPELRADMVAWLEAMAAVGPPPDRTTTP